MRKSITPSTARPYVLVNMAMTADGKIATANRAVESFGSPRDHEHLLELRAGVDAVLCGARTASSAEVSLGAGGARYQRLRRRRGLAPEPIRVIVSGRARLPLHAGALTRPGGATVVLISGAAAPRPRARLSKVATAVGVFGREEVDLTAALAWLREAWGIRRLVCEGGAELNDAMLRAGLVDELHLTLCPVICGGRTAPTFAEGLGAARLADATPFTLVRRRRIGDEWYLVFRARRPHRG